MLAAGALALPRLSCGYSGEERRFGMAAEGDLTAHDHDIPAQTGGILAEQVHKASPLPRQHLLPFKPMRGPAADEYTCVCARQASLVKQAQGQVAQWQQDVEQAQAMLRLT